MAKKKTSQKRRTKRTTTSRKKSSSRSTNSSGSRKSRRKKKTVDSPWEKFAELHAGHPALKQDVQYALPAALIDSIYQEVPEFFSDGELEFEIDLAHTAGAGFFLKQPFVYPLLPDWNPPVSPVEIKAAKRQEKSAKRIRSLMADGMKRSGRTKPRIEKYFRDEQSFETRNRERQLGYAGWLATHPDYLCELCKFVARWEKQIRQSGAFPSLPISLLGERPPDVPIKDLEFHLEFVHFYQRWGLDTLAGWNLPVPMRPELTKPNLYPLSSLGEAGVTLFVPWHLLRFKDINIHEIASQRQIYTAPDHLREWLAKGDDQFGPQRYGKMLQLYIIFELCLKPRYGTPLRRKIKALTKAIAKFLTDHDQEFDESFVEKTETLRKIRREMNKRLRKCDERLDELVA